MEETVSHGCRSGILIDRITYGITRVITVD